MYTKIRIMATLAMSSILLGCSTEKAESDTAPNDFNLDVNGDGAVHILVLGTNTSIHGADAFSPDQIAQELGAILDADTMVDMDVQVVAKDIFSSAPVTIGLGGSGTEYTYTHYRHSLMQYYYWPKNKDERMDELQGNGEFDWDYVVIGADPYFVAQLPGYYSLGVHKVAKKVTKGGAVPLLLMMWSSDETTETSHFEEFTNRVSQGASVSLPVIPAGLAWERLSSDKKDSAPIHPTPHGAYLTAASIYSYLSKNSASTVSYTYDDDLADIALSQMLEYQEASPQGDVRFDSPFQNCSITQSLFTYNHTGSSSENGILAGLNWVFEQSDATLENGGNAPSTFNFGRANTNFEPDKRYKVNQDMFDFSFGFPMQDHGSFGDESMLYGLDKRDGGVLNDTDVGVARFMIEESEVPFARAIPIRTLFAQMNEQNEEQSAYRDSWHMHRDLDKSIAGYMYTLLTDRCALGEEPAETESAEWNTWMSHKIGCNTAWDLMYMEESYPF